jgi:hypothetical protein
MSSNDRKGHNEEEKEKGIIKTGAGAITPW